MIISGEGDVVSVCPEACRMFGASASELCGTKAADLIVIDERRDYTRSILGHDFRALLAGEMSEAGGIIQLRSKSEKLCAVEWSMSPLTDARGGCRVLVTLKRRIGEADDNLSTGGYRDVFANAIEGIFRSSIEGNYLEVNPALARMYGYESPSALIEQLRDLNTQLYVDPARRSEFVSKMNEDGFVTDFESEAVRADGTRIWISEFGRAVRGVDGRPLYFEGSVIDITARKCAEAAVRASEEKYRHLVEMTNVVPWEAGIDTGAFTYVGPQAAVFLGYSLEKWLEPGFWDRVVHSEDRAWVTIVRGEAIENRRRFECEYRLIRQDGTVMWVREISNVLPSPDERPILGGFLLDVTYRRESEAALRESQDFIEQIAAASPTISYLYDPVRKQSTYVNGRVPSILGYTKEALSEMQPFFLVALAHPDEAAARSAYFAAWTEAEPAEIRESEFRLRNGVGGWVWLKSRECVFRNNPQAGSLRILGTIEDITLQRHTMDELEENERIFRRLAETTGAIPFHFDLATQRFAYVGPQAETLFGYPLRRWYGAEFWQSFVEAEDLQEASRFADAKISPPEDFQAEFRVRAADGRCIWLRQIAHYAAEEDERKHVRGFFFDVTEARQAEAEREASRVQLRELSARGQQIREEERMSIAREIHDELGQALTLLTIDLAQMETRIEKSVEGTTKEILLGKIHAMRDAMQNTLRIVRRILCSLRPPLLDELGLKEAIEWQMEDFSKRVGIRYDMEAAAITLPNSCVTPVFRIFQEILTNAARHSKASRIKVSLLEEEREFVMRVEDNGVGIAPEKLLQTKNFGLLGMRERAWSVGGEVHISGGLGRGTTVTLRIPLPEPGKGHYDPGVTVLRK